MIGGSCYVMVYLAVAILIFFRRPLLSMKSSEDMVNYLKHVSKVVLAGLLKLFACFVCLLLGWCIGVFPLFVLSLISVMTFHYMLY